jgi:hypothetical protein
VAANAESEFIRWQSEKRDLGELAVQYHCQHKAIMPYFEKKCKKKLTVAYR